jgi:hypothetical protein
MRQDLPIPAIVSEMIELGLDHDTGKPRGLGKVKSWRYCHVRPFGPVSLRYSSSTKLVEGTSQEMLSPFSVRLSGANSLELQFTSIRFGVNGRTEKANLCRLEKLGKLLQGGN